MSEDIKIRIAAEANLGPLEQAQKKIEELHAKASGQDERNASPTFGIQTRKEALALQKSVEPQLRAAGRTAEADAAKRTAAELELALGLQSRLGIGYREAEGYAKSQLAAQAELNGQTTARVAAEKAITQQKITQGAVLSSVAGMALVSADIGITDFSERQGIGNRDRAQRAINERSLGRKGGAFGSSSQALSRERALEDSIFEEKQNLPELQRKKVTGAVRGGLQGAAGGALAGGLIGGLPGAVVGAVAGGLGYGGSEWLGGSRAQTEAAAEIKRNEEQLTKQRAERHRKFNEEEGGLKMEIARARGKHSIQGNNERLAAEAKLQGLDTFKRTIAEGGSPEQAREAAGLATKETLRERGLAAASGIVNARSGAGDVARAAQIASSTLPDTGKLLGALERIYDGQEKGLGEANERQTRKDFSQL